MAQEAQEARELDGVSLPPAGKYELDESHTVIGFEARHILTKVRGRFTDYHGTIVVGDSPETSSVNVEVKTASVETNFQQRDDHLRSADFFESDEYPVMTFDSTAIRHTGGTGFEIDGDLTIKDVTKPITLTGEFLGWGTDRSRRPSSRPRPRRASIARTGTSPGTWPSRPAAGW